MSHHQVPASAEVAPPPRRPLPRRLWWMVALLLIAATAALAWFRVGMLDLPAVPAGVKLETSGLAGLEQMKQLNALVWSGLQSGPGAHNTPHEPGATPLPSLSSPSDGDERVAAGRERSGSAVQGANSWGNSLSEAAALVRQGIAAQRRGELHTGLDDMRKGIRLEPNNLVLANAYRMVVFKLRRDFLASARQKSALAPQFPPELDRQPIVFFEELDRRQSTRETKLHLALAWVDEMLLFPALEIKAPSSVEAVNLLTAVIEQGDPAYVPALFARGLNHLHRPARLVWPESAKTPRDAAAQDIGRCVAIGRRLHAGSPRLQAHLALCLGDAYVKAGRLNVARSWWQIAQNLCRDDDFQTAIRRRYAWQNEEILDRLEEELDRGRSELDHPMTDLALMWN